MYEKKIRLGIVGLGNVAWGAIYALLTASVNNDCELVAIFTRRDPKTITHPAGVELVSINSIKSYAKKIDALLLCTETQSVPHLAPNLAKLFPVIVDCTDSSLTYQEHQEHRKNMELACQNSGHLAFIEAGWGNINGMFGVIQTFMETTLLNAETQIKFGPGVNLGHQNKIRNLPGVIDATVWTHPSENKCYVFVEKSTDQMQIEATIKERMYEITGKSTNVFFVNNQEVINDERSTMPHRAIISRKEKVGDSNVQFSIYLRSNPNYTGSLLVACARAAFNMYREGTIGVITFEDVAPKYFRPRENSDN